jgi:hypothetical protein
MGIKKALFFLCAKFFKVLAIYLSAHSCNSI